MTSYLYTKEKDKMGKLLEPEREKIIPQNKPKLFIKKKINDIDFSDIKGQEGAKRGF